MNLKKIKRAIISVSDKSNLKLILPSLKKFNIEIISSGGTYKEIKKVIKDPAKLNFHLSYEDWKKELIND